MRVAFVSKQTTHHEETAGRRRIERIATLLAGRGHDVRMFCTRWWDEETDPPALPEGEADATDQEASARADGASGTVASSASAEPADVTVTEQTRSELGIDERSERLDSAASAEEEAQPWHLREIDGVTYHGLAPGSTSRFLARLPVLIAQFEPDVVHATPEPPAQVIAGSVGGTLARAPLVVEWFGGESAAESRLASTIVREPATIITGSEMMRTRLRERGGPSDRIRVIPNNIDLSQIKATEPAGDADIVYAHRLDESANLEDLLLALAELRDRDFAVDVIGDGPKRSDYERQVRDLRIEDRITFRGACTREERIATYRNARAFVQTAREEYFATELLWALASGCIGIVEYQTESSAHELIDSYARSFRVTSPQELADAIVESGEYDLRDVDESFATYDERPVLEQYLDVYRRVQTRYSWL